MEFDKKAILVKEDINSIHFKCSCGIRVVTAYFNAEEYLETSSVDKCPNCGSIVDENDIPDEIITHIV